MGPGRDRQVTDWDRQDRHTEKDQKVHTLKILQGLESLGITSQSIQENKRTNLLHF